MLDELDHPTFVEVIEESSNVGVKNVIHLLPQKRIRQRVQRLMLATPRAKSVREAEKVFLVDLVEDGDHSLLSGRTVARSGLRMMPTFPLSPLSFRTAGFPQYGWKVGLSGSAFPHVAQVKPAPGIPCSTRRFASAFRALRCPTLRPALCRNSGLSGALPFEESTPLPQRSSLRSGFYCPSPSTLNRPHPSHSQAHPDFAAWRFIPDALAVLVRLGDPRVVPCFHCTFLLGMPSSTATGSPSVTLTQSFTDDMGLRQGPTARHSQGCPSSASDGRRVFAA